MIKHPQKFNKDILDITLVYDQYFKKNPSRVCIKRQQYYSLLCNITPDIPCINSVMKPKTPLDPALDPALDP